MSQPTSLSKTLENIILKARNIDDVELEKFSVRILKSITEIENLRQLLLTVYFVSPAKQLSNEVMNALLATICDEKTQPRILNSCLLILSETSPLPVQLNEIACNLNKKSLIQLLPLLSLQKKTSWTKSDLIPKLLKYLQSPLSVSDYLGIIICIKKFLSSQDLISLENACYLNQHFVDVLSKTSIYQAPSPYTNLLFRKSESNEVATELDRKPIQDTFTILNLAQYNSEDQFMNICSFSLMRNWLRFTLEQNESQLLRSSTFSKLLQIVRDYCVRVIDQSEYAVQNINDKDLQKASLVEVISLLDLICNLEPSHTPLVFSCIKRVNLRISDEFHTDAQASIVFTSVVQFLLHHGNLVAFDVEDILHIFFTSHIPLHYWDIEVAFEYVQFILNNRNSLSEKFNSFTKYFPSMMKILAWYPKTFLEDFAEILPLFICETTAAEAFHLLLDLPCLTASLIVSRHSLHESSQPITPTMYSLQKKLNKSLFKPMLAFMMRSSSGVGDTFNKLKSFHEIMECINDDPRVVACSELAPVFLNLYFDTVLKNCSAKVLAELLPVILERVNQIYNIPGFTTAIHKVLAEQILNIFKLHPYLAIDVRSELLEYISHMHNIQKGHAFYMNVIWIIGEYVSANFHPQCSPKLIMYFYEGIECISYETIVSLNVIPFALKLLTIIATTLSKLATRSQDLIPRAKLCLSKMNYQVAKLPSPFKEEEIEIVTERIEDLVSVLRSPNIASVVLNPQCNVDENRLHRNDMSVPFVLKSISTIFD